MICQVTVLNANGTYAEVANNLGICLLFNMSSSFAFISPVFQCLQLNLLLRTAEKSSNFYQSGATWVCFQSISWTKMLVPMCGQLRSKATYTTLSIFFSSGKFSQGKDRQKFNTWDLAPGLKKAHKISFSILNLFLSRRVPFVRYLSLSFIH